MEGPVQLAISTPALLRIVGVAPSTLNNWVHRGLCAPTVVPGEGKRATRYWSARDAVIVRVIKTLRDVNCSLAKISDMCELLAAQWDEDLAGAVLLWDGKDVVYHDPESLSSVSLLSSLGQGAFTEAVMVTALPLGAWMDHSRKVAEPVDLSSLRTSRDTHRTRRAA